MNYNEAVAYMNGLLRFGWKLGNERFVEICRQMQNPQEQFPIVHIAGTKGKGSTTALSAAILAKQGYRTGAYFSPYVYDLSERIQVDGIPISRDAFAAHVSVAAPLIEQIAKTDLGHVTEFELKTVVGFVEFARQQVEFGCIEVGLGGRMDATNIVSPVSTAITNIGLDHTQILGDTYELIAGEKAGIIKDNIPCVTATDHPGALAVIREIAATKNAPLAVVSRGESDTPTNSPFEIRWEPVIATSNFGEETCGFRVATSCRVYDVPVMRLAGLHQRVNAACAITAVETALSATGKPDLSGAAVAEAMRDTALPGRLSTLELSEGRLVVMDGAHNALAAGTIQGALQELKKQYDICRTIVVIGMLNGHDPKPVVEAIVPGAVKVFVCSPNWKRAQPAEELAVYVHDYVDANAVEVIPDVKSAVEAAVQFSVPHDMILITGSFYTVGEAPPAWIAEIPIK